MTREELEEAMRLMHFWERADYEYRNSLRLTGFNEAVCEVPRLAERDAWRHYQSFLDSTFPA